MSYHVTRHVQIVVPEILRTRKALMGISTPAGNSWIHRLFAFFKSSSNVSPSIPANSIPSRDSISPYAEWDNVFLPYAVESFNGVAVVNPDGTKHKPVRFEDKYYVEFRLASKTENIDYTLIEAQQF